MVDQMYTDFARHLFETGRAHALSAEMLYLSAVNEGQDENDPDPKR